MRPRKALVVNQRTHVQSHPVNIGTVTMMRNRGLVNAGSFSASSANMNPGDPAYSPTDSVTQNPMPYPTARPETSRVQKGPGQSPGWWHAPHNVNPSQYIDQNVGGMSGDTKRMNYTQGIMPFTYFRQSFTGAVLTPPRPRVIVVGNVGRLGYRDTLAARVQASTTDYGQTTTGVANSMINPQLGW